MGSPKKQTPAPDNGKTGTSQKARAKPKSSTILDDFICFASRTFLPVGVLDTGEQTVNLGESMTVKQAMIEAEFDCKFQDFYYAKNNSNDDKETAQALQEAEDMIDKKYRALKVETAIDISEIKLYFGPQARELCMMQCRQALVCPQGILFAEPKFDYTLFKYAAKQLGNSFGKFKLKGQGTWYLHYMTLPEIIPIFRLVGDSKKKLLDAFNEGDFFYKLGTSFVQTIFGSLDKANELDGKDNELIEAAVEDSATEYVRLGDGPKVRQKFQEIFKTPYNPDAIEAAGKAGNELAFLFPAIEAFRDAGTPAFNVFKSNKELEDEMNLCNSRFDTMLEAMGNKKDSPRIAAVLSKIQKLKTKNNPEEYDNWRTGYTDIYDEFDDINDAIKDDAQAKLCKAYGSYFGDFYYNVIWEIRGSIAMGFLLETGLSIFVGGGVGIIGTAIGKKAAQEVGKKGAKYILKEAGKRLGREAIENGIMTGFENLDAIPFLGGRDVNLSEVAWSLGIGTFSGAGLGALGDLAKGKIKAKQSEKIDTELESSYNNISKNELDIVKQNKTEINTNSTIKTNNEKQIANLKKSIESGEVSDSTVKRLTDVRNNVSVQVNAKVAIIESEIKKYTKEIADYNAWIAKKTKAIERLKEEIKNKKHVKKNRQRMGEYSNTQKNHESHVNELEKKIKDLENEKASDLKILDDIDSRISKIKKEGIEKYNQKIIELIAENREIKNTNKKLLLKEKEIKKSLLNKLNNELSGLLEKLNDTYSTRYARWDKGIDVVKSAAGLGFTKGVMSLWDYVSNHGEIQAEEEQQFNKKEKQKELLHSLLQEQQEPKQEQNEEQQTNE